MELLSTNVASGKSASVVGGPLCNNANGTKTQTKIEIENELATKKKPLLRRCFSKSVEPLALCWMVPLVIASIAIKNLQLEKACRVNFKNDTDTCSRMIHRSENSVVCHGFSFHPNDSSPSNTTTTTTTTTTVSRITKSFHSFQWYRLHNSRYKRDTSSTYDNQVCTVEYESQLLGVQINSCIAPIDSSVALSVIIYVVGFFERRGSRKLFMLLPMLGDLAALIVYLVAAIFFDQLPTEFHAILGKLCSSFGGKENLMLMALYSYLADTTPKLERLYRFAVFGAFLQIIPTIFNPLSALLFRKLGYIKLFTLCIAINLIGILYALFWLKDVKILAARRSAEQNENDGNADLLAACSAEQNENDGNADLLAACSAEQNENDGNADLLTACSAEQNENDGNADLLAACSAEQNENDGNADLLTACSAEQNENDGNADLLAACSAEQNENDGNADQNENEENADQEEGKEETWLKELMNPSTVVQSIHVVFRKRQHNKRRIVVLFVVLYFIVQIPIFGETDLLYDYTRNTLDWGSIEFCSFSSICNFSAAVGIIILIGIGSRLLGMADAVLGLISSVFSALARLFFTTASNPIMFYAGIAADMFVDVRVLALKNIITLTVDSNEIRKAFCLIAILDVFLKCVSVPSYSKIYEMTINSNPKYLYAPSLLIFILASALFCILYFAIREQVRAEEQEKAEEMKKAVQQEKAEELGKTEELENAEEMKKAEEEESLLINKCGAHYIGR